MLITTVCCVLVICIVLIFEDDARVVHASDVPGSTLRFTSEFTSKSVPNFKRCVLEQGIGHELRVISDSFYLEFSGFVSLSCLCSIRINLFTFWLISAANKKQGPNFENFLQIFVISS